MRMMVDIKFSIPSEERSRGRDREAFWRSFAKYTNGEDSIEDFQLDGYESQLSAMFASNLEYRLRRNIPDAIVLYRSHYYGSLVVIVEIIAGAISSLGLTPDDILSLVKRYSSDSILQTNHSWSGDPVLNVDVTGNVVESERQVEKVRAFNAERTPNPETRTRGEAIWWIANTSLVIPALVLVAGAYLFFMALQDERAELTRALIQERTAIAADRQKIIDGYDARLKAEEAALAAQAQYLREIYAIDIDFLKARLEPTKAGP